MPEHARQKMNRAPLDLIPGILARDDREQKDGFEKFLDVLVVFAKITLSILNAAIVSWGIHANGNFHTLGEPWAQISAICLGVCIQIGVMAGFYRVFTKTGIWSWKAIPGWALRTLTIGMIAAACITFEVFHSLTVQIKGSAGEQLELRLKGDLHRIQAQITTIDALISGTYETQIQAHLALAADALHGRDDSGIAIGGPRYKEQMRRYAEATSRFGSLATNIPAARNLADVNEVYQDAQARLVALTGKNRDLELLFSDVERNAPMPNSVAAAFDTTKADLDAITPLMNKLRYATPQSLAINGTFELVQNAANGRVEHKQDLFALAYAVASNAVLVLLFVYSGIGADGTDVLRRKHLQQQEELDLLRKMGRTESEIWGATESWFSVRSLNERWRRFVARRKARDASGIEPDK